MQTKEGPLVVSRQPQIKPRNQLWCSGCARQGHMEHECNYFRQYPPTKPSVVSYEDVLPQRCTNLHKNHVRSSTRCYGSIDISKYPQQIPSCEQNSADNAPLDEKNISYDNSNPNLFPKNLTLSYTVPSPHSHVPLLSNAVHQVPSLADKVPSPTRTSQSNSQVRSQKDLISLQSVSQDKCDRDVPSNQSDILVDSRTALPQGKYISSEKITSQNDFQNESNTNGKLSLVSQCVSQNIISTADNFQSPVIHPISTTVPIFPPKSLKQSVSIQDNRNQLPLSNPYDFTERDYDNFILEANSGLLNHIRSIQFGTGFMSDGIQVEAVSIRSKIVEKTMGYIIREDQKRISDLIINEPASIVREFLRKEMRELVCWVSKRDPVFLQKQYFKYNKLSLIQEPLTTKTVSDKCFWFRVLNMYLFGIHGFEKGKENLRILRGFLGEFKQKGVCRADVVKAHKYVFGVVKHSGVNYPKLIEKTINGSYQTKNFNISSDSK
ncbi:hypothetical protein NQ314_015333 [Rhamnusium bicolor]|uniref:Uncharacterized protein n=1 Tax=Rhamnusium bicolor TaxID=1586634 RepID=A0AAV8WZX7_9CUCU|nr:hypothetical protein NQ314_015333 [Rhamnusium bicolor]